MWNGLAMEVRRVLEGLYYQFVYPPKATLMSMLSQKQTFQEPARYGCTGSCVPCLMH